MRGSGLTDQALADAVLEMTNGLIDADLGGHVFKKRVALAGRGKSAGARTLVATKLEKNWFFLFGFGKNQKANIDQNELAALRELANRFLSMTDIEIDLLISIGELTRVNNDDATKKQTS